MRVTSALLTIVLLAPAACTVRRAAPEREGKQLHIATAADSAFVRRVCFAPDSVLAGARPCYARDQQPRIRVF
jgi:hypothetical protein